jgi:hypothetical protein
LIEGLLTRTPIEAGLYLDDVGQAYFSHDAAALANGLFEYA